MRINHFFLLARKAFLILAVWTALALTPARPALVQAGAGGVKTFLPLLANPIPAPLFKWKFGGCHSSWCETGWYSSPVAVDIDGNGKNEIVAGAYSLWALDGDTGALIWRVGDPSADRIWPGIVLADIDLDGEQELLTAQKNSWARAYRLDGSLKWQAQPAGTGDEFRGIAVADLENDGSALEVILTRISLSSLNTWVLDAAGKPKPGKWPQMSDGTGYAWGVNNANQAVGDLRPDIPGLEILVPSDKMYVNAYDKNGSSLPANSALYPGKAWGAVSVWESLASELRGYGDCDGERAESYRANFAHNPAVITDVNGDGVREVVVTGNVYDCSFKPYLSRYAAPFIFNADRSRFVSGAFDWSENPRDTGAPLSEDYNVITSYEPNPVVADIDGDGYKEILYASYDGRMHAFWLDKREHGSWPYAVYHASEGVFRYASEPVLVDLDNDGRAEVIFASWVQKGFNKTGKLHILRWDGVPIYEVDLPQAKSGDWNGAIAAPTLARVGSSPNLSVILNTTKSGVVVYELPRSANARVLWGTGRGNYARTGDD